MLERKGRVSFLVNFRRVLGWRQRAPTMVAVKLFPVLETISKMESDGGGRCRRWATRRSPPEFVSEIEGCTSSEMCGRRWCGRRRGWPEKKGRWSGGLRWSMGSTFQVAAQVCGPSGITSPADEGGFRLPEDCRPPERVSSRVGGIAYLFLPLA
ncbi:hypothetical protein L1887_35350 [Cichorium endivia]|nr:hypothetical protein L1887_35350 [Cichorium endivia]